ncbi:MAG: glycosyltransferase family 2 protein [Porticoccaceae bacterium]|nr:glycosyltransferase family 2 protein [Porticoccaceae bacterium]
MTGKLPITVIILTKNEQEVIERAIESSINYFSQIIVLDSFSDDLTVALAEKSGAEVYQRRFDGYASQRNYALKEMPKKNDWILFLDADEMVTDELAIELSGSLNDISNLRFGMAYMRRKDFFMGRWLRRSSGYPTWFGRLCHAPSVNVEREINEEYHCSLPTIKLSSHLLHYPFAKGLAFWVERHNRYSSNEALEKVSTSNGTKGTLFSIDPGLRRIFLKKVFMKLPMRPLIAFLYLYFFRMGFIDGRAGFRYAVLRSFYEFLIDVKSDELILKNMDDD